MKRKKTMHYRNPVACNVTDWGWPRSDWTRRKKAVTCGRCKRTKVYRGSK